MTTNLSIKNLSSEENYAADVPLFWIYVCQGLILMIPNALIFGAIAYQEPLRQRKEYIIIAGLALIDFAVGYGLLTAGLIRNLYIMEGTAGKTVSRITCLLKPWNFSFAVTDFLSHVFLLTISIDRFITVKFPLKYYKFTTRYAYLMVGGTYLFVFLNVFVGIILTLPYTYPEIAQICYTESAFESNYYQYYTWFSVTADFSGSILYAVVIYLSVKTTKLSESDQRIPALQKKAMSAQRKVTQTLGICSLCTFVLYCIPLMLKLLLQPLVGGALDSVVPYAAVLNNLNPITNFFIFTIRQRHLRVGVKNFLKCNKLTEAGLQLATTVVDLQINRQVRTVSISINSANVRKVSTFSN